jgi:ABC-type multidrug transport system ATPase subunit
MELKIEGLSKTYPNGVKALQNVSLTIKNGMFGLLGPNGAGKSSLMRTLATLQEPDSGTATLDGLDVIHQKEEVRRILGYLPQEFGVYPKTSAVGMLNHIAMLKGVTNRKQRNELVSAMLQRVNLYQFRFKSISGYSGGMKQRFGIAQALLCNPKLLIVDEPTAGLDPSERNRFYNLLAEVGENTIVILSTHIVQDVRELCSDMTILSAGRVVYSGSPADAVKELEGQIWQRTVRKEELDGLRSQFQILSTKLVAGKPLIHVLSDTQPGEGFSQVQPELEDVYFNMTATHQAQLANT